jgi:hypothetical protein
MQDEIFATRSGHSMLSDPSRSRDWIIDYGGTFVCAAQRLDSTDLLFKE